MLLERPETFRFNKFHPLAQGLVFAGLGAHAGSTRYHDSSAFGNSGTLTNTEPATDWRFVPQLNRMAFDFDGSNEYSIATACRELPSTSGSASVWINPDSRSASCMFEIRNGTTNRIVFYFGSADVLGLFITGGGSGANVWTRSSSTDIATGAWCNLIVTWDTTTDAYAVYKDAVALTPSATNTAGNPSGNSQLTVGIYGDGSTNPFNGRIADLNIYNRIIGGSKRQQLADPSNVMLSGLLQPPLRKWWPVVSGAAPTFKAAWLARQNKVLGGGAL